MADFSVWRRAKSRVALAGRLEKPGGDADIDGPLVEYKEKGHKAELVGHDSVEGTDVSNQAEHEERDMRYTTWMRIRTWS